MPERAKDRRRVVFTGFGGVGANGDSTSEILSSIYEGRSPIRSLNFENESAGVQQRLAVKIGGEWEVNAAGLKDKFRRRGTKIDIMAARALDELLAASSLLGENGLVKYPNETAFIPGSGVGNNTELLTIGRLMERDPSTLSRVEMYQLQTGPIRYLGDQFVDKNTIRLGIQGPSGVLIAACASSLHSTAVGRLLLLDEWGNTKIAIVGGADAALLPLALHTFGLMKALSTNTERDPKTVSRPFDRERDGFVLSEGAIFATLEDLEFAQDRGAKIRSELIGYGVTTDAKGETDADVDTVAATMNMALRNARISVEDIDLVVAHATSTINGDRAEATAIKNVLGPNAQRIPVVSVRGQTGHYLGAAGAINQLVADYAIETGRIPFILNTENPDGDAQDLDLVLREIRKKKIDTVMVNNFGFGGKNSVGIIRRVVL